MCARLIEQVKVVRGDVSDQALLERVLGEYEIDTVIHLAAQTIVGIASRNPVSTYETNIGGTWALLEACRRSPSVKQIVVASSDKAYGDAVGGTLGGSGRIARRGVQLFQRIPVTALELARTLKLMNSGLKPYVRNEASNEIRHQYLSAAKARQVLDFSNSHPAPGRRRFSRAFIEKSVIAILVLLLSLAVTPFYTRGDQSAYWAVYEKLPYFNLTEGFTFYQRALSSQELVHFILSWVASRFVDKDLFITFSNAILAYTAMSLFQKWKVSIVIAYSVLLTNFYFLVLYFAAERLKFGFIFFALSLIYIDQVKRFYGFSLLALTSHVQVAIVYGSILFNFLVGTIQKLLRTGKISKPQLFLFLGPVLFILQMLVWNQMSSKFQYYYGARPLTEMAKMLIFLLLALRYSKKKSETFILFAGVIVAVFLVGGDRVNVLGYFVFLFYGLQFRRGWNFGVLATSAYYAYSSYIFLAAVYEHGDGFFEPILPLIPM